MKNSYEYDMKIEQLECEIDDLKKILSKNAKNSLENLVDFMIDYHNEQERYTSLDDINIICNISDNDSRDIDNWCYHFESDILMKKFNL